MTKSSRPEVFCRNDVLKNFAKFTGKHLGPEACNFMKKETLRHRCYPVKFAKFLRTPIFMEHLWWLLLYHSNGGRNMKFLDIQSTEAVARKCSVKKKRRHINGEPPIMDYRNGTLG